MRRRIGRAQVALVLSVALGATAVPAATAAPPTTDYCENVRVNITQDMPAEMAQAIVQEFVVDENCRVKVTPPRLVDAAELDGSSAGESASAVLDGVSSGASEIAPLASVSRVGYGSTQIWDCCGILLTEHWLELRWTSSTTTNVVTSWGATHGAKWHREAVGGWSLDPNVSSLGRVSGGSGQQWIKVKGRQGFKYQGVFDPTGTLFYNDLSDTVTGSHNGGQTCTHAFVLRKVPAGPLAWKPAVVKCVKAAYPNP